jgi:CheY-like chemotaxis protein
MNEKLLFVDDEPSVLEGYKRMLGREFSVDTAVGGFLGLASIAEHGPYAVVISDMRMPQMDGAHFLARVRETSPASVRLALTGYADIETAMGAVNEGNIFRFLTKPCSKENLLKAIEAALVQSRLIHTEDHLLENTLRGCIHILAEMLSFSNPAAFGRAMRLRRFVQHVEHRLQLAPSWKFEIAAMLSQLGCVTLNSDLVNAAYSGDSLTQQDQQKYDAHPSIAGEMLSHIPRMEAISQMIAYQTDPDARVKANSPEEKHEIEFGIQLLRAGLAYDRFLGKGYSPTETCALVRNTAKGIDQFILDSLDNLEPSVSMRARECAITELSAGMILQEDLRMSNGMLIIAKGHELTFQWIERLKGFLQRGVIRGKIVVWIAQNPAG